jgi:hypothetical protein
MDWNSCGTIAIEIRRCAEECGREIAELAAAGGDCNARMREQEHELAAFALEHRLREPEIEPMFHFYQDRFVEALELETAARVLSEAAVAACVDRAWSTFLTRAAQAAPDTGAEAILHFNERCHEVCERLATETQRALFAGLINDARLRVMAEYQRDPGRLKTRLGVASDVPTRLAAQARRIPDGSFADALRAAVRASAWVALRATMRGLR